MYYYLAYKFHIAMIMVVKQQRRYLSKINFIQTLEFIPHRSYHEPDTGKVSWKSTLICTITTITEEESKLGSKRDYLS